MSLLSELHQRADGRCELCSSPDGISVFEIEPRLETTQDGAVLVCGKCRNQIQNKDVDEKSWYALKDSMWSEHSPVQVLVYRILRGMGDNAWAQDLISQMYLDEGQVAWAEAGMDKETEEKSLPVLDSNGSLLNDGDTVTLIKDLDVKGANFTAKRGTTVKNISLTGDPKYVEGKVNGMQIVLVAAYLKKA